MRANTPRSSSERIKLLEASLRAWQKRGESLDADRLSELAIQQNLPESIVQSLWLELQAQNTHQVQIIIPLEITTGKGTQGYHSKMRLVLIQGLNNQDINLGWIAAAETAVRIVVHPSFKESLHKAREALNALDPNHPIWPNLSTALVLWHCEDLPSETELSGGSAGCMIALGLAELFRQAGLIPKGHRLAANLRWKTRAPLARVTASAQIDSEGYLQPVADDALEHKLAVSRSIDLFLVSPAQMRGKILAAAASKAQVTPAANLQEALLLISAHLGEHSRLRIVRPVRLWRWAAAIIILSVGGYVANELFLRYPPKWVLDFNLPHREASIDTAEVPSDCSHTIQLDDFTDYSWRTKIWGPLSLVRSPFALVIGSQRGHPAERPSFGLPFFGDLGGIRSLTLWHSEIAWLDGVENLTNIVRLADIGSGVTDLRWAEKLIHLKTLVLDSGFLKRYPNLAFPELEELVIHVPPSWKTLNVGLCTNLRRLAVRGDGLEEIEGLDKLIKLEDLTIHSDKLRRNGFIPAIDNQIATLALAGIAELEAFDLSVFPHLKTLDLANTSVNELQGQETSQHLQALQLSYASHLESLDLSSLSGLLILSIDHAPLHELKSFSGLHALRLLILNKVQLKELNGLTAMPLLKKISIHSARELSSLDLNGLFKLETLEISNTSVKEIQGLGDLVDLQELSIEDGPFTSVSGIERLHELNVIKLSDTLIKRLPSLKGLSHLSSVSLERSLIEELPELGATRHCYVWVEGTPFQKSHPEGTDWTWELDASGKGGFTAGTGYVEYTPTYAYNYNLVKPDGSIVNIDADGWEFEKENDSPTPKFFVGEILKSWEIWPTLGVDVEDFAPWGAWETFNGPSESNLPPDAKSRKPEPRSPFQRSLRSGNDKGPVNSDDRAADRNTK